MGSCVPHPHFAAHHADTPLSSFAVRAAFKQAGLELRCTGRQLSHFVARTNRARNGHKGRQAADVAQDLLESRAIFRLGDRGSGPAACRWGSCGFGLKGLCCLVMPWYVGPLGKAWRQMGGPGY